MGTIHDRVVDNQAILPRHLRRIGLVQIKLVGQSCLPSLHVHSREITVCDTTSLHLKKIHRLPASHHAELLVDLDGHERSRCRHHPVGWSDDTHVLGGCRQPKPCQRVRPYCHGKRVRCLPQHLGVAMLQPREVGASFRSTKLLPRLSGQGLYSSDGQLRPPNELDAAPPHLGSLGWELRAIRARRARWLHTRPSTGYQELTS
mmetsp:Transcript_25626/g.68531  ORF Transcript_25626/g.68531 Transcript_25626/m.68531 type:complete len:203 (+) Transcript_25626:577-1185(+)